jgi:hypothetical protein
MNQHLRSAERVAQHAAKPRGTHTVRKYPHHYAQDGDPRA